MTSVGSSAKDYIIIPINPQPDLAMQKQIRNDILLLNGQLSEFLFRRIILTAIENNDTNTLNQLIIFAKQNQLEHCFIMHDKLFASQTLTKMYDVAPPFALAMSLRRVAMIALLLHHGLKPNSTSMSDNGKCFPIPGASAFAITVDKLAKEIGDEEIVHLMNMRSEQLKGLVKFASPAPSLPPTKLPPPEVFSSAVNTRALEQQTVSRHTTETKNISDNSKQIDIIILEPINPKPEPNVQKQIKYAVSLANGKLSEALFGEKIAEAILKNNPGTLQQLILFAKNNPSLLPVFTLASQSFAFTDDGLIYSEKRGGPRRHNSTIRYRSAPAFALTLWRTPIATAALLLLHELIPTEPCLAATEGGFPISAFDLAKQMCHKEIIHLLSMSREQLKTSIVFVQLESIIDGSRKRKKLPQKQLLRASLLLPISGEHKSDVVVEVSESTQNANELTKNSGQKLKPQSAIVPNIFTQPNPDEKADFDEPGATSIDQKNENELEETDENEPGSMSNSILTAADSGAPVAVRRLSLNS